MSKQWANAIHKNWYCCNFVNWENFYGHVNAAIDKNSQEWFDLASIDGIGEMTASSLVDYFASYESEWVTTSLIKELQITNFSSNEFPNSPFLDRIIVFTGSLKNMTRAEAKSRAEYLGAKVSSSVSKKTDFLVIILTFLLARSPLLT